MRRTILLSLLALAPCTLTAQEDRNLLQLAEVFELEHAVNPQFSPDGRFIAYQRSSFDIMKDRSTSRIWIFDLQAGTHRPLSSGLGSESSPVWGPRDSNELLFVASDGRRSQIHKRFMDSGEVVRLTTVQKSPSGMRWSPDQTRIVFSMAVPEQRKPMIQLPGKPEGATWAAPAKVITDLQYRSDGGGYIEPGHQHLFMIPADGGTPRQLTSGDWDHGGDFCFTPDGEFILLGANRREDSDYVPNDSEVWELNLADGSMRALTERFGPDRSPRISPDGETIAYVGFEDRFQGHQQNELWLMPRAGGTPRLLTGDLDRGISAHRWTADGKGILFQYDDEGHSKVAHIDLEGKLTGLAEDLGGNSLGRPYSGGSFTAANDGRIVFTATTPERPADLVLRDTDGTTRQLTALNEDLLGHKTLGATEEFWCESSHDGRRVQGWIVTPPDFDPSKKYPLILEIHGGPFSNYGWRFSTEIQLFAAAGYVVLYTNPRGSTSYGEEFANLIHHNYPSQDYDDLMTCVDTVLAKGYVDAERLFITGGSGGGVLTSWSIGKTDRFRAAVVAKPVINWYSFVLTADSTAFFYKYWFPGLPWEHERHYMSRSPLSLVGNVTTPTMVLTGEVDYRTPMSESEQYYAGLKLNKVDAALVRIQEASHGIAARPSNLMRKIAYILHWFDSHDRADEDR